jgi:uncharacterized membrane protein YdfJ with MMPL/SSD domain
VAEWGRTTLEMIVQDLQRPVILDESFERRVMVRVRRLYREQKKRSRGWTAIGATIAHRPAWAALVAAGIVAIATAGVLKARPHQEVVVGGPEPVKFVLVAP